MHYSTASVDKITNSDITQSTSDDDVHVCPLVPRNLLNLKTGSRVANSNHLTSQHVVPCLGKHLQEGHDDGEHHPEVDPLHVGGGRQGLRYSHEAERTCYHTKTSF